METNNAMKEKLKVELDKFYSATVAMAESLKDMIDNFDDLSLEDLEQKVSAMDTAFTDNTGYAITY